MSAASGVRRLSALVAVAAGALACALVSTGASNLRLRAVGTPAVHSRGLIPASPEQILPLQRRTVQSTNWSGYAVTSKTHMITAVSGTFVVPKAGSVPFRYAATWAGIGGYFRTSSDLIQAGTAENSSTGGASGRHYYAWYELLPKSEQQLHNCSGDPRCRVKPGDHIAIDIRNLGGTAWTISVRNVARWSWHRQVNYNSTRTSAEWILEAPDINGAQTTLAPVGTVHFGPASKFSHASSSRTIAQGKPVKIVLTGDAKPSALARNGQSFNDCAYASSCPAP